MKYRYSFILFNIILFPQATIAGNFENYKSFRPFLEAGYAKIHHINKLKHFENLDFDLAKPEDSQDILGYNKRRLKSSNAFYLQVGIQPHKNFRFGLEYIQTGQNKLNVINYISSVDEFNSYTLNIKQQFLLLNFNYHPLGDKQRFSPYFGIGIGASKNRVSQEIINLNIFDDPEPEGKRYSKSAIKFAWSLQAGFQYKLDNNLYFNTSYKFINSGSIKGSSSEYSYINQITEHNLPLNIKGRLLSHVFMVGLGYKL